MKAVIFQNRSFYWILILVLLYTLIWNVIKFSFSWDPSSLVVIVIEIILFVFILAKHEHTKLACFFWASYFLIKSGAMIIGLLLEHSYNDFILMEEGAMLKQILKFSFGLAIILYSRWFIKVVEVTDDGIE